MESKNRDTKIERHKGEITFNHGVLTLLALDVTLSLALLQPLASSLIKGSIFIIFATLTTILRQRRIVGKGEVLHHLVVIYGNLTPFIFLLCSLFLFGNIYLLRPTVQVALTVVIISACQFLENRKHYHRSLKIALSGWVIVLATLTYVSIMNKTHQPSMPERYNLYSSAMLLAGVSLSAYLTSYHLKNKESEELRMGLKSKTLEVLTERNNLGLFLLNISDSTLKGNRPFYKILGIASEGSFHKINNLSSILLTIHPNYRLQVKEAFQRVKTRKEREVYEDVLFRKSNEKPYIWVRIMAVLIVDNPKAMTMAGYIHDIDREKRDVQQIDQALRASGFIPWKWFVKQGYTVYDSRYVDLFGAPIRSDNIGITDFFKEIVHREDLRKVREAFNQAYASEEGSSTLGPPQIFRMKFSEKADFTWVEGRITGVERDSDGNMLLIEGIVRNINEEKERALRLEQREKEIDLARQKSIFFSTLSHELRTPMNVILGMSNILEESSLDSNQKDKLEKIKLSSELLLGIISDLLDYSQLDRGNLSLDKVPFSFSENLERTLSYLSILAEDKGIQLVLKQTKRSEWVIGDPNRINQILMNLVKNAISFSQGEQVTITSEILSYGRNNCTIKTTVEDRGAGIPPEDLKALFTPLEQGDSSHSRSHRGSGMGLPISQKLVDLMKGSLEATSRLNEGSIFSFTLTLPMAEEGAEERRELFFKGGSVLVVDDNPLNLEIATDILSRTGVKVLNADSGYLALEMIEEHSPQLVLMDVQMPEIDGLETTRRQRKREKDRTPIVALTANVGERDRELCLEAGMDDHLPKPIERDRVYAVLEKWLSSYLDEKRIEKSLTEDQEYNVPTLPGIAMKETLERFAGEYDILTSLIKEFTENYCQLRSEVDTLYNRENWEDLHRRIHALKGVSGSLGITEVFEQSKVLINQYRQGGHFSKGELTHLSDTIEEFCTQINPLIGGAKPLS